MTHYVQNQEDIVTNASPPTHHTASACATAVLLPGNAHLSTNKIQKLIRHKKKGHINANVNLFLNSAWLSVDIQGQFTQCSSPEGTLKDKQL